MSEQKLEKVLITTGGYSDKKFHKPDCRMLGENTREIDRGYAEDFYSECKMCFR